MYDTFHSNHNQATALFKAVSQMLTIAHVGFLKVLFEFCHIKFGFDAGRRTLLRAGVL
jgi:hypothetical protein